MNNENDTKLCKDFPLLYIDRNASAMVTCMCWGFSCGDGWFDIIYSASTKLEPLIRDWLEANPTADYSPRASQVKEKYGTLRFYMTASSKEMDAIISDACRASRVTCEECGQPGETRNEGYWLYVRCDKCWEKLDNGQ